MLASVATAYPASAQSEMADWRWAPDIHDLILPSAIAFEPDLPEAEQRVRAPMLRTDLPAETVAESSVRAGGRTMADRPPVAYSASPFTPPPSLTGDASAGVLGTHLRGNWQKIAFIGGVVLLAFSLFWRLGRRGPNCSSVREVVGEVELGAPVPARAKYASLQEAIAAMKADGAAD